MGSRHFHTLTVLYLLLMTVGALASPSANGTNGVSIARFLRKGTPVRTAAKLTDAERYARALTRRKPTRRGSARRQEPSDLPPVPQMGTIGVMDDSEARVPVGNLIFWYETLWVYTDLPGSSITYTASPSWTKRDQQRLTYTSNGDPEFYWPFLGAAQCGFTSGMDLRPGSSDHLCLVNVASPGTPPGSLPVVIPHSGDTDAKSKAAETDIWTIDYSTGEATVQWINPDGSSFPNYILRVQDVLTITGDVAATAALLPFEVKIVHLKFTAASS